MMKTKTQRKNNTFKNPHLLSEWQELSPYPPIVMLGINGFNPPVKMYRWSHEFVLKRRTLLTAWHIYTTSVRSY